MNGLFIVYAFVILAFAVGSILKGAGKGKPVSRRAGKSDAPPRAKNPAGGGGFREIVEKITGLDKEAEECEYGAENHEYSHEEERRVAQLDNFLKNGIIDKAEYQVLLKRYKNSGQ